MDRRQFLGTLPLPAISILPLGDKRICADWFSTNHQIVSDDQYISIAIESTEPTHACERRIVTVAAVEIVERKVTGAIYHRYLNPGTNAGAGLTSGITRTVLESMPRFADIADEFADFIGNATLISHDMHRNLVLLVGEFSMSGRKFAPARMSIDTFELARKSKLSDATMAEVFAACDPGHPDDSPTFSEALWIARLYLALTT